MAPKPKRFPGDSVGDDDVFYLERHAVDFDEAVKRAPDMMAEAARKTVQGGISTALAFTEQTGWVMILCGQSPFVVHREKVASHTPCDACKDVPLFMR